MTTYIQYLRNYANPYLEQARQIATAPFKAAYKYVTLERPDPNAEYYSNGIKIIDAAAKEMAIERETLTRHKTRFLNRINVAGSLGIGILLTQVNKINAATLGLLGGLVFTYVLLARKGIKDIYDPLITRKILEGVH